MTHLSCSLTGTASIWYDRLPQFLKTTTGLPLSQSFKKQLFSQKHAYHAQLEELSLVKECNESVPNYALDVQTLVKRGW